MSKRRQTIAAIDISEKKKVKVNDDACDANTPVSDLTEKQIRDILVAHGETPGPIMASTRPLYEKLIEKYRSNEMQPKKASSPPRKSPVTAVPPSPPCDQSTPAITRSTKPKSSRRKSKIPAVIPEDDSLEELNVEDAPVKIESLPEPPSARKIPLITTPKIKRTPPTAVAVAGERRSAKDMTNKELRDVLISEGQTPGPVNDRNRKLYEELVEKMQRGGGGKGERCIREETPVCHSTRIDGVSSNNGAAERGDHGARGKQVLLQDYPDAEDMDVEPSLCVSYAKSPYQKTRRSICKAEFTDTDFVVVHPFSSPSSRPSFYHELKQKGVQALVVNNSTNVSLVNAVKAARGSVKIYAGVTVMTVKESRLAVSNALQCGCDAVVISFNNPHCSDSSAIVSAIKQMMEGHLTASYFYSHNSSTPACPVRISKELLELQNGYQGIFASPDSVEKLLLLESLAIKIYETDVTKILRSLAHGIDSFASCEGIVGMPVICKLKEEYYEGNTSESCRLQLVLCR